MATTEKAFRFNLAELGGALGDVGTLVPLAVALIAVNGMSPVAVLLIPGLLYIASGLYYRVPVPVQPLKAVAAIAIAMGLAPSVISASGLVMGAILIVFTVTGAMGLIIRLFSAPVVRGIQLGVGLLLLKSGFDLILRPSLSANGHRASFDLLGATLPWGLAIGAAGLA